MDRFNRRDFGPPGGLITLGLVGLVVEVIDRWLGGRLGGALAQVGAGTVSGGALVFFSRLAAWLSTRRRR